VAHCPLLNLVCANKASPGVYLPNTISVLTFEGRASVAYFAAW
jgi:hypothetical protein